MDKEKKRISGIWILFLVIIVIIVGFLVIKISKKTDNENVIDKTENKVEDIETNKKTEEKVDNKNNNENKVEEEKISKNNKEESGIIKEEVEIQETTDTSKFYMGGNAGGIDINKLDNAKVENGEKVNTSDELSKDKEFGGLKFMNIKVKSTMGSTEFIADVINEDESDFKSKKLKVVFLKKDGTEMGSLPIYIPDLSKNNQTTVDSSITEDYVNAYNIKITN